MTQDFDFNAAVQALLKGQKISGKDGVLGPLIKNLVEAALEAEVESHIADEVLSGKTNRKNGRSSKTIRGCSEPFGLKTPRDRSGTFEPQLIPKHQTTMSDEIEERILSMYGLGMSYQDISGNIQDIYQVSISKATISAVTDKIIGRVKEWQCRPLESVYPFVWLDAIHYNVKEDGHYSSKAVYTVLGVGIEGKKEVLGLYLNETEGAKFWLSVLTDLRNRGVQDILIASVDGLIGFPEAIRAIFPETQVQLCVVHQIRNSLKYVTWKDKRAFMKDLKEIYGADTLAQAEEAMQRLDDIWGEKYPLVIKSWLTKWDNLTHYFQYPAEIRKVIYTTNIIESVHRQFRKLTKTKGAFPNENSLMKLLYLGVINAQKKWTMPIRDWQMTIAQLSIFFEGRLDGAMTL